MMMTLFLLVLMMLAHPMSLVMGLVLYSFVISVNLYFMMGSFWLSYLLMLVIVSGLMVIFSYMVNLIPNERFGVEGGLALFVLGGWVVFVGDFVLLRGLEVVYFKGWEVMYNMYSLFMLGLLLLLMVGVVWVCEFSKGAVFSWVCEKESAEEGFVVVI